jgi:hypothetical protein
MAAALRQATRYRGFDEGHLFNLAGLLLTNLQEYYLGAQTALHNDTAIARVPADMIANRIKQAFIDLAHELFETPFWLDKTPTIEMVSYAPFFLSIWPNARFILTKRRGIENVMSRQRKFPDVAFEGHCLDWAGSMRAWLVVRAALEGKAIEVDQFSMSHDPSQVASDVSELLGLHATEAAALAAALRETRVEQTSADARRSVSLASVPWSEAEKHIFRQICGPMMEAYGYSDDESYFR